MNFKKGSDFVADNSRATKSKNKKNSGLINFAFTAIIVLLIVYAIISIITQQAEISKSEANLQTIRDEITEAQQENDELVRALSAEDEKAYMERVAIEKMGYGYANERRYYAMGVN